MLQVVRNAALVAIDWGRCAALVVLLGTVLSVLPAALPHDDMLLRNFLETLALRAASKPNVGVNAVLHDAIKAAGRGLPAHPLRLLSSACCSSTTKQLEFVQLEQLWSAWCPACPDKLLEAMCTEV